MRLCRFQHNETSRCGFYEPGRILPIDDLAAVAGLRYVADAVRGGELERLLPTDSTAWHAVQELAGELESGALDTGGLWVNLSDVALLPPIARPNKLLLLAGNYAAHVQEQGGVVAERERTFPYVFMKPASTTLVGHLAPVAIPVISPNKIDHEVELAVVIGRTAKHVSATEALNYVAGYTLINDLSDRGFKPNPNREERPRDKHFDWSHGKWHDGFCPCGPNLTTPDEIGDPQQLGLKLWVNGDLRQDGTTADQVFSVAEVIEFISSWMTLEPGDIIATGTPAGVGNATGKFLKAGDRVLAEIVGIGQLENTFV